MGKAAVFLRRAWAEEPLGCIATFVILLLAFAAVAAPLYAQAPDVIHPLHELEAPSWSHLFGTDDFGRDVFSRVFYAGRVSLGLGLVVTATSSVIGAFIGMVAGFVPRMDGVAMRLMDGMMAFPPLVLAIALVAALGPGLVGEFIALSVVFTPRMARVVRSSTLQLRDADFVRAASISGVRSWQVLAGHVLPNSMAPLIVQASFNYAEAILADAALSFLGLGLPPPTPTWGNMMAESRTFLTADPLFSIFPGIAIIVAVMAINLVGDSLRALISGTARRPIRIRPRRVDQGETPVSPAVGSVDATTSERYRMAQVGGDRTDTEV